MSKRTAPILILFLLTLLPQVFSGTTSPIFVTTISGSFQSGSAVLSTSSLNTSGSFSYQSTTITYANTYFATPAFGYGIKYIYANWITTSTTIQTIFDVSNPTSTITSQTVKANFTSSTVQQFSINYIVCLPNTYFFLDVRNIYQDLTSFSTIYSSALTSSRSQILTPAYKTKSNSTNAQVIISTVGLSMMRQSNTFEYTLNIAGYNSSSFNLTLTLMANNGMRFIRYVVIDYETTASSYTGYVDMGVGVNLGGTVPDSSGMGFTTTGTIFTGVTDWAMSDANAIITYNMSYSSLTYSLSSRSVSRTKTAYLWYRDISCPSYYFLVGTLCYACDYTCTTCSDTTNTSCVTCQTSSYRTLDSNSMSCPCNNNYLDVGSHVCQQIICPVYCTTCSSNNFCIGCVSSYYRTLSNGSCICTGYTIDMSAQGLSNCQFCYPTCYTCSVLASSTACLTCNLARDHREFVASNNTCVCTTGYYEIANLNTLYANYLYVGVPCLRCLYHCQTCTGNTSCLSCNSTLQRLLDSSSGLCYCAAGYYDDGTNQACVACSYTCATCNSSGCLTCPTTRSLTGLACPCLNGYYDSGAATCSACLYHCYTCTNGSTCATCNSTYFRSMASNKSCVCLAGYYDTGVQACVACDSSCASCNGANSNNCLSCSSTKNRQITSSNTCGCMSGYYDVSPITYTCATCYYKCATCSAINTNCTSCSALNYRTQSGTTCNCNTAYYDDGGNQLCQKCLYFCLTCTNNFNCTTCDSATRNTTNLTTCPCLTGFYQGGVSSCQPCLSSCLTCLNPNNCTTCPSTRYLSSSQACLCNARTYQPACAPCASSCLTCSVTYNNCVTCNGTAMRYLSTANGSSTCQCYATYYDDGTNQLCVACNYTCATCTNASACLTCPTNRQLNGSYCSCLASFYQNSVNFNCVACHYSCLNCSSYSVCTACNATNFRTTSSSTTLCVCMNGYYDNGGSGTCFACLKTCATCSSYSVCTSCNGTLNLYISGTDCLCTAGYFLNATSLLCVACHYSCTTCTDNLACTGCQANRTAVSGSYCFCVSGMFDSSQTLTCQSCAYPCLTCVDNSSKCLSCDTNRNYSSSTNQCICKSGTYDTNISCAACLSTCQTCTNGSACLTCLTGSLRVLDSTNQCVCPTGYHDENGTVLTCKACNYTCVTCIVSTSCSSCYGNRIAVSNSYCICPSTLYYDNGASPQCLSCKYSCLSCSVILNNCTSCLSTNLRTLSNNTCVCNTKYYDDGSTAMCQSCHYSCLTCTSNSSCLTCNSSSYRQYLGGPYCSCMTGYFDVTNTQLCSNCSYTCLTCISGSLFCSSCPTTRTYDNSSSSCPCNSGMYDSGSATCTACGYSCVTCSNASSCLSCPSTRQLSSAFQCQCNNGYYDVANQLNCSTCPLTCQLCSNYQTCTQCDTAKTGRLLVNNSCVCTTGYYDASLFTPANYSCQLCPYSCATCLSSAQCTSCETTYKRTYNLSNYLCSCADGYYDDGSNSPCIACPYDCLTCSNGTTCLTCSSTRYLSNTSRCVCTVNYYTNGNYCQQCPSQCSTCTSSSVCTGCVGVRILSSGACICPVALYSIAGSANCSGCHYSCASCVSSTQCSTCNSTLHRYLTATFCFCMQYYYDDLSNQTCQSCQYSCLTCNQSGVCLTCDNTKNRIYDASGLCICASGYYQDSNKVCIKCSYSCLTCVNSSTSCTSCYPTSNRVLNTGNNSCQCPTYYYYDTLASTVCASCDYSCYSCSGSSSSCTSCLSSTFRVLNGSNCPCSNGYYSTTNQPVCSTCGYQCVTCQGDPSNCTLCSSANFRSTIPACGCIQGFYDNGTAVCLACVYTCATCLNVQSCSTCDLNTSHRQQNNLTQFCDCIDQYYDNGNAICQPCYYTCLTCNHPTNCQTCPSTRALSLTSCLCLPKYYDDNSSLLCKSCNYTCQTCSNISSCSSCNSLNFRVFNSSSNLCSCKTGYYDLGVELCSACDASCLTCIAANACQTCPNYINKTINSSAGTNFCVCFYGYYQNATAGAALGYNSVCNPCHYSCQTCNSTSTYCTLCNSTANRYLTNSHQCSCLVGYFEILGQQNCLGCYSNCLSCFGTLASNCLSCDNTSYYLNNSCYTTCPSYYTNQSNPSRKCVSCPSNCLSCPVSTTVCSSCASPYFIFAYNSSYSVCVNSCPQYYYQLSQTCLACVWPCVTCNSSTSCLSCSAGYYFANNYCYPCQKSCLTCSGSTALDCITCVVNYILKNGVCQKLQCADGQYVDSTLGCLNCSSNFANSLTCLSTGPLTCQPGYLLKNNTCGNCTVVTGYVYDKTTGRCKDLCGDGIVITDLCDDGNTLNGDGCSSVCTIETGWRCPSNLCQLIKTPNLTLVSMKSYPSNHTVILWVQLTVGLRLIQGNFILKFSTITNFAYTVNSLNAQYTIYQIIIVYYQSPQNEQLSISVKSPISRLLAYTSSRDLQSTTLQLNISLSLSLSVPIQTTPPAIYVSQQNSQIYSQYIVGLISALHVGILVAIGVVLIKRLKVMLLIIDALNSITILYILGGLGLYNITLLSGQSFKGLQPFIYPFGETLQDQTINFYQFNYRSNFFSSTAVQVLLILISLIGLAVKAFSDENSQNYWHYYRTSFVFAFSYDLLLSSFCTFFWSPYTSYQSSYSWMASLFTLVWILCEGVYYYKSMSELSLDRKIVPDFTHVTGVNQQQKGKNEISNIMFQFEQSKQKYSKQKEKEKQRTHQMSRDRDDPRTEEGEEPMLDTTSQQTIIRYYDLTPSNQSVNTVLHSNHITHTHLPILSIFFAIVFSLVVNIQTPKIRAGLLLGAALGYLLTLLITKNQTIKAIRTIKLMILALLYVVIAAIGLAGATLSSINLVSLDIVLVVIVCVALLTNLICFIVNVLKSQAYREHVKQKQIQEANERKKKQAQYRQKIYNTRHQQANTTNSKLAIEEPKSSFNIFQHQIQVSEEQVEEKQLKISSLKKFRDQTKAANNREKNNSTMLHQIDDQFSGVQEGILARKDLIDQKSIVEIRDSRLESAKGNRIKAIRDSQLSRHQRKESPSSYFDNTLQRIQQEKVKRKGGKSNEREQVSPTTVKKRLRKKAAKGSNLEERRIDDEISLNNDQPPAEKYEDNKKIEDILDEMDMPRGFKREIKMQDQGVPPRLFDQISSIKEERRDDFMEQGIDDEKGGLSVFNKILQDYKVYRNKKVSKKKMKQLIEQPNK